MYYCPRCNPRRLSFDEITKGVCFTCNVKIQTKIPGANPCPFYELKTHSPYYAGIRCNAYEQGREKVKFSTPEGKADVAKRDDHIARLCCGDYGSCPLYEEGVKEQELLRIANTYLYVVSMKGRTLWRIQSFPQDAEVRFHTISSLIEMAMCTYDASELQANVIHSSSPNFEQLQDELKFDDAAIEA